MHHHIDQVVEFVSFHAVLAYLLVFFSAFLEAIPIIGAIVPGSTVIFALSALVPSGSLKVIPLVIAALVGAALGDGLAYGFGYWQKHRVLSVWPLSRYPKLVAESEDFFRRNGTLAVFFARFAPPFRAFVPVTAGATAMPPWRFFVVDWAAVLVWAAAMIAPGIVAGSAAEQWGAKAEHYALPLVAGLLVVGGTFWYWRRNRLAGAGAKPLAKTDG
ncbi:MAG: DedA family protein [Xanthobacteraceae bacterium]|nr:DedA family protein [Xanthobacteraceae bacterium]